MLSPARDGYATVLNYWEALTGVRGQAFSLTISRLLPKFFMKNLYISYILCIFVPKIKNMEATVRNSTSKSTLRRKVIDIKPDTFRGLSVIAASRGTNLKNFIESSLDELVESYDDGAVYRYLRQTDPEGLEMVSEDEKQEFEKRLGL